VWRAEIDGQRLRFHLAGINNQNFLMRDEETGTYWQQISGRAIAGALAGRQLTLVPSDELTMGLWKAENPKGTVLTDLPQYALSYAPKDWDVQMRKVPTVLSCAQNGITPRDIMLGIRAFGASRAFLYDAVLKEKLVQDHVGAEPITLIVGPDDQSVRAFRRRIPSANAIPSFYRVSPQQSPPGPNQAGSGALFLDDLTGSAWNFQGCAVSGSALGRCLEPIQLIKDYWFDWRHYNPSTTIYRSASQ
jgi:hypothetical protein